MDVGIEDKIRKIFHWIGQTGSINLSDLNRWFQSIKISKIGRMTWRNISDVAQSTRLVMVCWDTGHTVSFWTQHWTLAIGKILKVCSSFEEPERFYTHASVERISIHFCNWSGVSMLLNICILKVLRGNLPLLAKMSG